MKNNFVSLSSITINAPISVVWDALTNPAIIKQYLFGTNVTCDWKVGSPITYKGVWEGKEYEDKGVVIKFEPNKILETTYWSNMAGLPDLPENYKTVKYEVVEVEGGTKLTISQNNNDSEEARDQSSKNWGMILTSIKGILEK